MPPSAEVRPAAPAAAASGAGLHDAMVLLLAPFVAVSIPALNHGRWACFTPP